MYESSFAISSIRRKPRKGGNNSNGGDLRPALFSRCDGLRGAACSCLMTNDKLSRLVGRPRAGVVAAAAAAAEWWPRGAWSRVSPRRLYPKSSDLWRLRADGGLFTLRTLTSGVVMRVRVMNDGVQMVMRVTKRRVMVGMLRGQRG